MMSARFILGKWKIIDTDYNGKEYLKELIGLTPAEKELEDFLNTPCEICGVLRGNHSLATMGKNLHPFTKNRRLKEEEKKLVK